MAQGARASAPSPAWRRRWGWRRENADDLVEVAGGSGSAGERLGRSRPQQHGRVGLGAHLVEGASARAARPPRRRRARFRPAATERNDVQVRHGNVVAERELGRPAWRALGPRRGARACRLAPLGGPDRSRARAPAAPQLLEAARRRRRALAAAVTTTSEGKVSDSTGSDAPAPPASGRWAGGASGRGDGPPGHAARSTNGPAAAPRAASASSSSSLAPARLTPSPSLAARRRPRRSRTKASRETRAHSQARWGGARSLARRPHEIVEHERWSSSPPRLANELEERLYRRRTPRAHRSAH